MSEIKLFPHQQKVLEDTRGMKGVGYFLDMGLGKTYLGSEKMKELGNKCNLLICQKSKIEDWIDHFKEYYPEYKILNWEDLSKHKKITKEEFMEFLDGDNPYNSTENLLFRLYTKDGYVTELIEQYIP